MEKKSLGRSFMILSFAGIFIKILSAAYVPLTDSCNRVQMHMLLTL